MDLLCLCFVENYTAFGPMSARSRSNLPQSYSLPIKIHSSDAVFRFEVPLTG